MAQTEQPASKTEEPIVLAAASEGTKAAEKIGTAATAASAESVTAATKAPEQPAAAAKAADKSPLFQPSLLLQGWFVTSAAEATSSTFRVRRAEVGVKGTIVQDRLAYGVMIDPAKLLEFKDVKLPVASMDGMPVGEVTAKQPVGAASIFQDFYIRFMFEYADVSVGQFKIPVSMEGFGSSAKLIFPERSMVAREFGDKRDLGVSVGKKLGWFGYTAGLYNGAALNNLDVDNSKDAALRLDFFPIEGITLSGVGYASIGDRDAKTVKDRVEADAKVELAGFLVQAEYIRAWNGGGDARVRGHGFYGTLGYNVIEGLQVALRAGYLDTDLSKDLDPANGGRDEAWHFDAGFSYQIVPQARLMASFGRVDYQTKEDSNEVIAAAQLAL